MNLIYTTDSHGRANNPISRLDDFPSTVQKKLKWAVETANAEDAYLLHGGDIVNRPDTSPSFFGEMAATLATLKKLPLIMVLGNHDIYGHNPESYIRTPLYILELMGLVKILSKNDPFYLSDAVFTGVSAYYDIDKNKEYFYPEIDTKGLVHFHIVHSFLTDHVWPHVDHILIKDILDTPADVILTGHEHAGFGIVEKEGKIFCNPGALARVTAGVGDVNKIVRVAKFVIKDGEVSASFINCPKSIAKPWEEVIDRDKLEKEKAHEEKMQKFFSELSAVDIEMFDTTDIFTTFKIFAEQEKLDQKIQDEIIKRLSAASERTTREEDSDEE